MVPGGGPLPKADTCNVSAGAAGGNATLRAARRELAGQPNEPPGICRTARALSRNDLPG
jgi:hypothetical protein